MATRAKPWLPVGTETINGQVMTVWENPKTKDRVHMPPNQNPNTAPVDDSPAPVPVLIMNQGAEIDEEEIEETATDRIAAGLQQIKGDAASKVQVFRIDKTQPAPVFVFEMTPDQYEAAGELAYIQQNYGGGEYEIRLRGALPSGRHGIVARPRVVIANPPLIAPTPNNAAGPNAGIESLAQMMFKGFEMLANRIDQKQAAPAQDPMQVFSMMKMAREAMGLDSIAPAAPAKQQSPLAMLKEVMEIKQLLKEDEPGYTPPQSATEKLLDMAAPLIGSLMTAHRAGTLPPDVSAQVGAVAPMLPMLQGAQVQPEAMPQPVENSTPQTNPIEQPAEGGDVNYFQKKAINFKLEKLNKKAAKNEPVTDELADEIAAILPEDAFNLLAMPEWFEFFSEEFPIVKPYEAWYRQLRDKLIEESE
jgi:hypothetical protein